MPGDRKSWRIRYQPGHIAAVVDSVDTLAPSAFPATQPNCIDDATVS